MKFLFILLATTLFLFRGNNFSWKSTSSHKTDVPGLIADFEKQLTKDVARDTNGSFSAVIFKGDDIIWSKAFGKSNNQKNSIADTNTIYRIASISKTITACLMMLLVQKGIIQLDEPVIKYVPEMAQLKQDGKNSAAAITFRQLASHTSGLQRDPENFANATLGRAEDWEKMLLEFIPSTGFRFPPGQQYSYSNVGYGMLGLALSRAAKKPFIELVNQLVFQPHGMTNSFYIIPTGSENKIASGYHWYPNSDTYSPEFADRQFIGRSYSVPPGGVFATANDLARFAIALTADSDALAKNYRDTMQSLQTTVAKRGKGEYGLGLMLSDDSKEFKRVGHDGQIAGFLAFMRFNPDTRIGIILFRNNDKDWSQVAIRANTLLTRLLKEMNK